MRTHHLKATVHISIPCAQVAVTFLGLLLMPCLLNGIAHAQRSTGGTATSAQTPGSPAGSYVLSDFDNVNLFNGNLNFNLSLLSINGRGSTGYTIPLKIERRWTTLTRSITLPEPGNEWYTSPVIRTGLEPGYSPGVMQIYYSGYGDLACYAYGNPNPPHYYRQTMTKMIFTSSDGTEYEFVGQQGTGIGGTATISGCDWNSTGFNRGNVFKSIDGSAMTFISDVNIYDVKEVGLGGDPSFPSAADGYLLLKDGTRYRIEHGIVKWIRDRNGNLTTFAYDSQNGGRLQSITDSIGRRVEITYTHSACGGYDEITYKGFGGAPRKIKVGYSCLENILRMTRPERGDPQTPAACTYEQLFPSGTHPANELFNPRLISFVELPDQRKYQFSYNIYGELARVELPTGGVIEYDYGAGWTNPQHPSGLWGGSGISSEYVWQIYRRVLERRVYVDKTEQTPESRMIYGIPTDPTGQGAKAVVEVRQYGGSIETPLSIQRHHFIGNAVPVYIPSQWYVPPDFMNGKEEQTDSLSGSGTLLRGVAHDWNPGEVLGKGPYIAQTLTTLAGSNPQMVSRQTFTYDNYNNLTDTYEYEFGENAPGTVLLRRTHTDYLTTNAAQSGVDYTAGTSANSIHIRHLPIEQWVSSDIGGINKLSRITYEYDNYQADASHAALTDRQSIIGLCTTYTSAGVCVNTNPQSYLTRGNVTAISRWLLPNTAITAYSQYDIADNVVKAIDARGNATTISYEDNFGEPSGDVQPGFQPTELGGQQSYAFPSSVTNALGHTVLSQYDYYLGRVVDAREVNGIITSGFFADPLDRPTRVILANNIAALRKQKTFSYDDLYHTVTVTSDLRSYNDNLLQSQMLYDGLGRALETRAYENAVDYISTTHIPFAVEQETSTGAWRAITKVSNPYRLQQGETPMWTTTMTDSLGRVVVVKTPDNAVVETKYDGARVMVTDQAGKKRVSRTNALGQLTDVWEITSAQDAEAVSFLGYTGLKGYRTSYTYDALSNLRKVEQGAQRRYFHYDSLSRLLYARNPEQGVIQDLNESGGALVDNNSQWSVKYTYDAAGNLSTRTDARGVITNYAYDALNRNTSVTYTDGTPSITRRYDSATNGTGLLWQSETSGATGTRLTVDAYDALGRPLMQKQQFQTNGAWGKSYTVQRSYGLAGQVASQTYPSGHAVTYDYDVAGRLANFNGNLGDGVERGYALGMSYDEAGRMLEEKYGTLTPLYHKLRYNVRGQLFDVRLSTLPRAQSETDWNRGCLAFSYSEGQSGTDNNGNVRKSETYVPMADGGYYQAVDIYSYDDLNRLDVVTELPFLNGQALSGFTQDYEYDRYGNRQIRAATTTANINRQQFEVEAATNRLVAPGDLSRSMSQRQMRHDAAGNLTFDSYTGTGSRIYDAENRMTTASDTSGQTSTYTYDADGRRVRRNTASQGEVWQIYGMEGELLAEYGANVTSFIPKKEYGYRAGQLLVTAANGDEQRLRRFIQQMYRGTLGREATEADIQHWFEWLAGQAEVGNSALLAGARMMAAYLLDSPEAYYRNRTDREIVQDLYWAYFGRGASQSEEDMWTGRLAFGSPNPITRAELREVCANWIEFNIQVTALWGGNTTGEEERTEHFLWNVYMGAVGAAPSQSVMQPHIEALNQASAQGEEAVITKAREIARSQIASTAYTNRNRTDREYVRDLYQVFWQRAPDQSGWEHWTREVSLRGRESVLLRFATSTAFKEVASTLYRETLWLIADHLGTPRMIAERTGSLSGIKRHDYLPFGEEIFAGTAGRTSAHGYVTDSVRQQFTGKERDDETGLDYFLARYYSLTQGRFTSPDEFQGGPRDLFLLGSGNPEKQALPYAEIATPQSLNKYQYAYNNPLRYIDPNGHDVIGYELIVSGQNQVSKTDRREVSDVSTLGPKDTTKGGFFSVNLKVDFDKGDNLDNYKHVRAVVILSSAEGIANGEIRNGSKENPSDSHMRVEGQSRYVYDNPGQNIDGAPKATLQGTTFAAVFVAGEYNKQTKTISSNVAYYGVKVVFGKDGKVDTQKSMAVRLTREQFINLTKGKLPKDKNKAACPECLLSPPNKER
jgi:RHS repeat-associated protein